MKAAKTIGQQNDLITNVFRTLQGFLDRLEVLGEPQGKVSPKLESVLAETLCQLLVILGLTTKVVKKGRLCKTLSYALTALIFPLTI
jgi:hypothetical protein